MTKSTQNRKARMFENKELGAGVSTWLASHYQFLTGGLIAALIAFFRIAYEYTNGARDTSWGMAVTESILCGLLAVGLSSGLELFNFPNTGATFVGSMVGFLGIKQIKKWIKSYGDNKAMVEDNDDPPAAPKASTD